MGILNGAIFSGAIRVETGSWKGWKSEPRQKINKYLIAKAKMSILLSGSSEAGDADIFFVRVRGR